MKISICILPNIEVQGSIFSVQWITSHMRTSDYILYVLVLWSHLTYTGFVKIKGTTIWEVLRENALYNEYKYILYIIVIPISTYTFNSYWGLNHIFGITFIEYKFGGSNFLQIIIYNFVSFSVTNVKWKGTKKDWRLF